MSQKWKLQDIQPASRPRRKAKRRLSDDSELKRAHTQPMPETELDSAADGEHTVELHTDIGHESERPRQSTHAARTQPHHPRPKRRRQTESSEEHFDTIEIENGNSRRRTSIIVTVLVVIAIVGGTFIMSALTGGAEVVVTPKTQVITVGATYTATTVPSDDQLTYTLLMFDAEGERPVKAAGQETVKELSTGQIFIYNTFSESDIRLVTNTRFESPDGLIFKISEPAIIPGYSTDENGDIIPGVQAANVFAEAPGQQYNLGPTRFTIPGFAGSPEFDDIYGESTSAFTGGFSGQKFILDETELQAAKQELHNDLRNSLLSQLPGKKPSDAIVYDEAVSITFESEPAVSHGEDLAIIKERGILQVPAFNKEEFAQFLAERGIRDYDGGSVRLEDYNALTFSYPSATTTFSNLANMNSLRVQFNGEVKVIWNINTDQLKADLLNIEKSETATKEVFDTYPAIQQARSSVRPFWKTRFPDTMEEITITEEL